MGMQIRLVSPFFTLAFLALTPFPSLAMNCDQMVRGIRSSIGSEANSIPDLVQRYLQKPKSERLRSQRKLKFLGVGHRDVYNITSEFQTNVDGRPVKALLGRVEPRENHESEVWFFTEVTPGVYQPVPGAMNFIMEDPFYTIIDGELIMGGVQTYPLPDSNTLGYRTVFYRDRGQGISKLQEFSHGPRGMKDIRLKKLQDGRIFVVTRPQGEIGGRGQNGFIILNSLDELTEENILRAQVLPGQVPATQWIGSNEIFVLEDDIGFLSHVAYYKNENTKERGYYVSVYTLKDPKPRIILIRDDLPAGESKRPDLTDVLFSGGMIIDADEVMATLYLGAGDAEAYKVRIPNPFRKTEN